jgi:hypothetical protein
MARVILMPVARAKRERLMFLLLTPAAIALMPIQSAASGEWLDTHLVAWNTPGQSVSTVPDDVPRDPIPPMCQESRKPAGTQEQTVVDSGWRLFGTSRDGHGIVVVGAAARVDGMCRPDYYQEFVFVGGHFAGTVSPALMRARSDGAAIKISFPSRGRINVEFARYNDKDPLCCPSRVSIVTYKIRHEAGKPVLIPHQMKTQPEL